MFSRRTRARFALLVEVALFPLFVREWWQTAEEGESPLDLPWFVAGFAFRLAYAWAIDRDLGGIRTKRSHAAVFGLVQTALVFPFSRRSERATQNFRLGGHVGHVLYRCWYGLLRPLPGEWS